MCSNHARQSIIIPLVAAASGTVAVLCLAESTAQARRLHGGSGTPCASCVEIVLDAEAPWDSVPPILADLAAGGAALGVVVRLDGNPPPSEVLEQADPIYLTVSTRMAPEQAIFAVRSIATAARATNPDVRIAIDPGALTFLDIPLDTIAPYVTAQWRHTPVMNGPSLADIVDASRTSGGDPLAVIVTNIDRRVVEGLTRARTLLTEGLSPLRDVTVTCDVPCDTEVFLQPETLDGVALVRSATPVTVISVKTAPARYSYVVESGLAMEGVPPEANADGASLPLREASRWLAMRIHGWRGTEDTLFATTVTVSAVRTPSVQEIVARHQAQHRRQQTLVHQLIARGSTTVLFEAPGFVAPVTITAETTTFIASGLTDIEQRNIRVNGAAITGGSASSPPQLPLIEPERVATFPFMITLTDAYTYELHGREMINGLPTYVIGFAPKDHRRPLVRGRAWIDTRTFALVAIEGSQTGLRGPIVSSEEHQQFAMFRIGREVVWLPVRTQVFQVYEGAGYRTPVHRTVETHGYELDPPDFSDRLQAAYLSPNVMLRDTPQGLRYLIRRSDDMRSRGARVIAGPTSERIRTLVFGLLVDPNITVALPFAGLSYLDLNVGGTGTQLNGFFGGTYGQLSWSMPSVGTTRWGLHAHAFAIAAPYTDRAFRNGVEQYAENMTQRPAHVSVGAVRPINQRMRVWTDYELDYTAFGGAATTAAGFRVPIDTAVHSLQAGVETQSGPWALRVWWRPSQRQSWRPWGHDGTSAAFPQAFQRYGAKLARTVALGPSLGSRVEVSWMAGRNLDRFSRYSFDPFENRLHGYPTASIRYDRGIIARSVTSWSMHGLRVDGFADLAVVRDPGFGPRSHGYPGMGAAVETSGPLRTLWSIEWGYGFRAKRDDGRLGTQTLRITGYRMF
jgi:hypothetical protein